MQTIEATTVPQLSQLLVLMHDVGNQLTESTNPVLKRWGLHLLSDWRSLDLIDQQMEPSRW